MPKYTKAQRAAYAKRMAGKNKKVNNYRKRKHQSNAVRAPFVECKKNQEVLVVEKLGEGSFGTFLPVSSFTRMNRGTEDDQFIGDSIFSKYISMKINFQFPNGENQILKPYRIQLIHGWMTAPYSLDTSGLYGPDKESVSRAELDAIVAARCGPEWNQAADRMNFRDKTKKIYKVEGKKWVTVDRNSQIGEMLLPGGPGDSFHQLHWKPMRKVVLSETNDSNSTLPASPFSYPNESWIPFVCVYTPDKDNLHNPDPTKPMPDESRITIQSMNCHWYTDS